MNQKKTKTCQHFIGSEKTRWCPVERGLEVQIAEKLRKLRELDNLDGKKAVQSPENNESNNSQSIPK